MAQHNHESRAKAGRRELDAADLRRRDDVAGDANDEEIAEPLIEDEFSGNARVGTAENNREGLLPRRKRGAPRVIERIGGRLVGDEPAVALLQAGEGFGGGQHYAGQMSRQSKCTVTPGRSKPDRLVVQVSPAWIGRAGVSVPVVTISPGRIESNSC